MRKCFTFILQLLVKHEFLVILLSIHVFLRIPSLFEPYWYGDEAIYLTIGNALRSGAVLYRDIVDHKTPMIYLLAMVPSQYWLKFLLLFWNSLSILLFYSIAEKVLKGYWPRRVATITFMLLTTLPAFEGNIANGELFVMGFVLGGVALLLQSSFVQSAITHTKKPTAEPRLMLLAGGMFSLAILTKVPAVFDLLGGNGIVLLALARKINKKTVRAFILNCAAIAAGVLIPIAISIGIFARLESLQEYLQFAFLYNLHYSNTWRIEFPSQLFTFLFTMRGKLFAMLSGVLLIVLARRKLNLVQEWTLLWFLLALFAALLSSRPYPHYFIQALPPLLLLLGASLDQKKQTCRREWITRVVPGAIALALFVASLFGVNARLYPTAPYYTRFLKLITKQISMEDYRNSFDSLMHDTYAAAGLIRRTTTPDEPLFIWGTNPMLYALSRRNPAGRFTVSFHIKDLNAYDETVQSIKQKLPKWIVVMGGETDPFPEFYTLLRRHYIPAVSLQTMTIYRKFL